MLHENVPKAVPASPGAIMHHKSHCRTLDQLYRFCLRTPSDIRGHLPLLKRYASRVDHVTEFGVRFGTSTAALLAGRPRTMVSYDIDSTRFDISLYTGLAAAANVAFTFCAADVLRVRIAPTDLLFVDTLHTYAQLSRELKLHLDSVSRYLALHDTETFGKRGEDGREPGLGKVVEEVVGGGEWRVVECRSGWNGMVVLERVGVVGEE
jgi:cephalosporin hydroxylase